MVRSTWVIALLAIVAGLAVGAGSSVYRYRETDRVFGFSKPAAQGRGIVGPAPLVESTLRSRLALDGDGVYDFGTMSRNERRSHKFRLQNQGNLPLTISFIDKSCQCTDVAISKPQVPPGESCEIELTWQPANFTPEFQQTARFRTNDPGRIELDLTIKGKVQQLVQAIPRELSFGRFNSEQRPAATFEVFSYRDRDLVIERLEWADGNTNLDAQLSFRWEPLAQEVVAREAGAVAGARVMVDVTGTLPIGRLYRQLRVHLNQPGMGPLDIPVTGEVIGDVEFIGKGYSRADRIWSLGPLSGDRIHQVELWILPKVVEAEDVEVSEVRVDPAEVLVADLQRVPGGKQLRFKLTLQVRPVDHAVNRLGNQQGEFGWVEIQTTLARTPIIRIPVAFAVESNTKVP